MRLLAAVLAFVALAGCVTSSKRTMQDLHGDACDPLFERSKACMPQSR